MDKSITVRQWDLLKIIYQYIQSTGYPPTFDEMRQRLKVKSNQSVIDLLNRLIEKQFIKRNESAARGIIILPLGLELLDKPPIAPFLGITHAGSPITAIEITGEWQTLSKEIQRLSEAVFVLKITGDSMINAGIDDGDHILVKEQREFLSGDIVLAEVDGDSTVKRFISQDKPPYMYLKPENPKYKLIYFTSTVEMKGKVISVLKSGQWQSIH